MSFEVSLLGLCFLVSGSKAARTLARSLSGSTHKILRVKSTRTGAYTSMVSCASTVQEVAAAPVPQQQKHRVQFATDELVPTHGTQPCHRPCSSGPAAVDLERPLLAECERGLRSSEDADFRLLVRVCCPLVVAAASSANSAMHKHPFLFLTQDEDPSGIPKALLAQLAAAVNEALNARSATVQTMVSGVTEPLTCCTPPCMLHPLQRCTTPCCMHLTSLANYVLHARRRRMKGPAPQGEQCSMANACPLSACQHTWSG